MSDKIRDEQAQAALDSERLRQIAEWLSMELGHEETAKRVAQIADRHDTLAAGFRTVQSEPSDAQIVVAVDAFMASQLESEDGPTLVHKNMAAALRAAADNLGAGAYRG